MLRIVVAPAAGVSPADEVRDAIASALAERVPAGAAFSVAVEWATVVPIYLVVDVTVAPGHTAVEVLAALEVAFSTRDDAFFDPVRWPIGAAVRVGDVYEALDGVAGVAASTVRWLGSRPPPQSLPRAATEPVQPGWNGTIRRREGSASTGLSPIEFRLTRRDP